MKHWIIGYTNSGKSTFAEQLLKTLVPKITEAGKFAREICPDCDTATLVKTSELLLRDDVRHFSKRLQKDLSESDKIVVGVRNPVDFMDSFNPATDYVYYLYDGTPPASAFEKYGIDAIKAIVTFFLMSGIMHETRVNALIADKTRSDWYEIRSGK